MELVREMFLYVNKITYCAQETLNKKYSEILASIEQKVKNYKEPSKNTTYLYKEEMDKTTEKIKLLKQQPLLLRFWKIKEN